MVMLAVKDGRPPIKWICSMCDGKASIYFDPVSSCREGFMQPTFGAVMFLASSTGFYMPEMR